MRRAPTLKRGQRLPLLGVAGGIRDHTACGEDRRTTPAPQLPHTGREPPSLTRRSRLGVTVHPLLGGGGGEPESRRQTLPLSNGRRRTAPALSDTGGRQSSERGQRMGCPRRSPSLLTSQGTGSSAPKVPKPPSAPLAAFGPRAPALLSGATVAPSAARS